jgi:hypothetical protein
VVARRAGPIAAEVQLAHEAAGANCPVRRYAGDVIDHEASIIADGHLVAVLSETTQVRTTTEW